MKRKKEIEDEEGDEIDQSIQYAAFLSKEKRSMFQSLPKKGRKDMVPDGSILQQQILDTARTIVFSVIGERRSISNNASCGLWLADQKKVQMSTMKGKHFMTIGHNFQRITYLYPEEALFLMEKGALKVNTPQGRHITVEEAYTLWIKSDVVSYETWITYVYMKRLGYILIRYEATTENSKTIDYKVYKPNSHHFRKSYPGPANFHLVIYSYQSSSFPSLSFLLNCFQSTISVKIAVVDGNQLTFFSLIQQELPIVHSRSSINPTHNIYYTHSSPSTSKKIVAISDQGSPY